MSPPDLYTAVTPFGSVFVDFPEDGGSVFGGSLDGIAYLTDLMARNTNAMGMAMTPDNLEPADLVHFCQPAGSGVLIVEPFDDLIRYGSLKGEPDGATTGVLDANEAGFGAASQTMARALIDKELIAMGLTPDADYITRTYGAGWKMGGQPAPTVFDDAVMNSQASPSIDQTITAMTEVVGRLASLAETQGASIAAALSLKPAPIELTLKSEPIHVTVEQAAPIVQITNEVPAAQVVVTGPTQSISEVQRDPNTQEILRTLTTHVFADMQPAKAVPLCPSAPAPSAMPDSRNPF